MEIKYLPKGIVMGFFIAVPGYMFPRCFLPFP